MFRCIADTDVSDGVHREIPLLPALRAQTTDIGLPSLSIGRHPTNMIVLPAIPLMLSRHHAVVTYDGEHITLIDMSFTNGTYVRMHGCGARLLCKTISLRHERSRCR